MTNLTMLRGDTFSWTTIVQRDGQAVDLTGAKIWFTGKLLYTDADNAAVFQKTELSGVTIDPDQVANRGKITVTLQPADTAALPGKLTTVYYDVQVLLGGRIETADLGTIVVSPDVTLTTS